MSNVHLTLACNAYKPDDPSDEFEMEDSEPIKVLFFPKGEEEEKIGRGGEVVETYTVTMLVVRRITPEFTRARLSKFVRALKNNIRGVRQAGYVYSLAETVSKFDPERLHEQKLFVSAVNLMYRGTAS